MDTGSCPRCGQPDRATHQIISQHRTSDGLVVYARCRCGRLQVRRHDAVVVRARR